MRPTHSIAVLTALQQLSKIKILQTIKLGKVQSISVPLVLTSSARFWHFFWLSLRVYTRSNAGYFSSSNIIPLLVACSHFLHFFALTPCSVFSQKLQFHPGLMLEFQIAYLWTTAPWLLLSHLLFDGLQLLLYVLLYCQAPALSHCRKFSWLYFSCWRFNIFSSGRLWWLQYICSLPMCFFRSTNLTISFRVSCSLESPKLVSLVPPTLVWSLSCTFCHILRRSAPSLMLRLHTFPALGCQYAC